MPATQSAPTGVQFNVGLSQDNYKELNDLAASHSMSIQVFVRNAIQVYNHLLREKDAGKSLYVGSNDKAEKEIIIPILGSHLS